MPNRIEGYIGCPEHGAYFRLEAEEARPGVFQNVKVALGEVPVTAKVCPAEGCGAALEMRATAEEFEVPE